MSLLQAIIMGIIQGVAEFLPISSSGHLALLKQLLNINLDTGLLYDILLHIGTLIAIFIAFFKDIKELVIEGFSIILDFFLNIFFFINNLVKKNKLQYKKILKTPYRRFVLLIIVSTIPTGIIGYLSKDLIENLSNTLIMPGLFLLLADNIKQGNKKEEDTSFLDSIIIGISQGIATMPGLSRSGTTIATSLICGLEKEFAVKYSFIMSIPAILGAALLEVKDIKNQEILASEWFNYMIGTIIAAIVGYICIKTMLVIVKGKKFKYFSYYCFIIGTIAIIGHFII